MSLSVKVEKRPSYLKKYILFHKMEKEGRKGKDLLKEKVLDYLKGHEQVDFKLVRKEQVKVDSEACMNWAKEYLSEEEYESCFVMAFDPDKFIALRDEKFSRPETKKLKKTFPAKAVVTESRTEIHPQLKFSQPILEKEYR